MPFLIYRLKTLYRDGIIDFKILCLIHLLIAIEFLNVIYIDIFEYFILQFWHQCYYYFV